MMRLATMVLSTAAVIVLFGCGGPAAVKPVKISGEVNLDKKPLKEGEIHFVVAGTPPRILKVSNGKFDGEVEPGKKKVQIFAFRKGAAPETSTTKEDSLENYIPARFNAETTLEVEIKADSNPPLKYDIESK